MKKESTWKILFGTLVMFLAVGALVAQDIPIRNWDVPRADFSKSTHLVGAPVPFAAISPPCRLTDTRVTSGGPGPIPGSGSRNFDFVSGGSGDCGTLPDNVVALSLFFTVVNPLGPGFIFAYPTGAPPASPVSIINYNAGDLRNNAAIVPVDLTTGSFTVTAGVSGTDLIIDINGVFYKDLTNNADQLMIETSRIAGAAIYGLNTATAAGSHGVGGFATGGQVHGVQGQVGSGSTGGASGVQGINDSTAIGAYGVLGRITPTGAGGFSAAVRGQNEGTGGGGIGVWGSHAGGGWGGYFTSSTGLGIYVNTGDSIGVYADTGSTSNGDAGVRGKDGNATPLGAALEQSAGILGLSTLGIGVVGIVDSDGGEGVKGVNYVGGASNTRGYLAFTSTTAGFFAGDLTATGTKSFIEPHPADATKIIRYISLEGNEAGTYFRGRGRFERGLARISVPEDFRMVTDEEGLSVQVTPIGEMASVAVVRVDLNEILVKSSRNVEFFYTVNGMRRGYTLRKALAENEKFFVPEGPDDRMPGHYSDATRAALISNGTFKPDGTVNMETAERLGWTKGWAKQAKARDEHPDQKIGH